MFQSSWLRFVAASFAAVMLMPVIPVSLQAQGSQTLYMPVLQASDSEELGLALSNPTLAAVTVTLTARDYAGAPVSGNGITNPATLTLPASGQIALAATEIFGAGLPGKIGWVELQSASAAVKGFFLLFDSQLSFIDGAELQTRPASRLVFPKASGNPASPTIISYVNTGTGTLRLVALTFYENSGQLIARAYLTVAPKSGFTGSIIDALPDAAGHEGYAVLETTDTPFSGSSDVLVGFETYRNASDIAALNAVPDTAASRIAYLPHFATGGGYTTRLSLVNFTNERQTLAITADALDTACAAPMPSPVASRTIPPNGRLEETADSLFGLTGSALCTGYIKWETQGNTRGVIGYLDYGTADGVLLSAVPAQSTSYSDLFFSQIAQGNGYYTGIALLNTNTQTSTINIDAFDRDGHPIASSAVTLTAGQRRSQVFSELFPGLGTQLGGYVRVSASRPIFAFQLFGSSGPLSFLANVSVQGVQLQPQVSGRAVTASAGANVISADANASVAISPGALSSDTTVSLNSVTVTLPPPSSTQQVIAAVDAQPAGTVFNIPVRLTFGLSAQLPPGWQVPVLIYTALGAYQDSGFIAIVDDSGRTASARVTHFTTFVLSVSTDLLITAASISPTAGQAGATVTIGGSGFSANASGNIVTFAGAENTSITAAVTEATSTSLTLRVPAGAITGAVIVRVGTRTSIGIKFTVLADRPKPSLSAISPSSFPPGTPATDIGVMGTSFLNASVVRMDGVPVATTFVDATRMLVRISGAQGGMGVHKLTVFTPAETGGSGGGESGLAELTIGFPMPRISSLSPPSAASADGSVTVTITGTGFTSSSTVTVNDAVGSATFVSSTSMTVILSSDKAINLPIVVSNPSPSGGSSGAAVFGFSGSVTGTAAAPPPAGPPAPGPPAPTGPAAPGPAAKVGLSASPASIQAGGAGTTITSQVQDQNGTRRNDAVNSITFSLAAGSGSFSATTVTSAAGAARTTLNSTSAGTITVRGSAAGLTSGTTHVTVTPGAPASLTATAGTGQSGFAGAVLGIPLKVQVKDAFGNVVPGVAVTFSVVPGGGSVNPPVGTTNSNGEVSTTATAGGTLGTQTFRASSPGLTNFDFKASITAGPSAANVTIADGDAQIVAPGISLLTPLKVHVTNAGGVLVPNATVNWLAASGGGSVAAGTSLTDSNGDATMTATAGASAGVNTFKATVSGALPATFTATAKALASSPAAVDVQISSGAIGVGSHQVQINFDATKVQVSAANVAVGNGAGYLLVAVSPDNNVGTLIINGFSAQVPSPAGNYTVAHVTFTPIRPGSLTLSTSDVVVTDINGSSVSSSFLSLSQTGLTIN